MENCQGEVCVLAAVDWVKDSLQSLLAATALKTVTPATSSLVAQEVFSRLWIYSHHIYNKSKRKNILEWSKELGLSGFSMPGKPGIVCVEGPQPACEEFWSRCVEQFLLKLDEVKTREYPNFFRFQSEGSDVEKDHDSTSRGYYTSR